MAAITAGMVAQLRERTGLGMMECKKALSETDGDLEAAVELLRKKGVKDKGDRVAGEGLIMAYIADGGTDGALVELNSETDFVARNDDFKGLARLLAEKSAVHKGNTPDEILADPGLKGFYDETVRTIGEKIVFGRMTRFNAASGNTLVTYVHNPGGPQTDGGKIGVMIELSGANVAELGREVAMHISFAKPRFLSSDDVDAATIEKETKILTEQTAADPKMAGKPAQVIEGAVKGRLNKFLGEIVLLNQPYIRDDKKTVAQLVKETPGAALVRFVCFQVGENVKKAEG
ncbi:translation elongation factor Ts [Armatimonas sp.]|uniref:translation elongation factor Ts n=1 Tax=Armatimonas sp. TaxID=1872638 RepID=UPI00286D3763|nr:translation elongation factor Ts [Armatimonas sp.]